MSWVGEQGMLTRHPLFLPAPNVPTATLPRLRRQILQRRNAIQRTVGFDRSTHWKQPKSQDAHVRSLGLRLNGSTPMQHTAPCLKEDTSDAFMGGGIKSKEKWSKEVQLQKCRKRGDAQMPSALGGGGGESSQRDHTLSTSANFLGFWTPPLSAFWLDL